MNKTKIILNLWQWACLVDFLRHILESVEELPFPAEYKGVERTMESIVRKYLIAHDIGLKDGKFSAVTRGPAILLDKGIFEKDFEKTMPIDIEISSTTQFRIEGYFGGVIKALKKNPSPDPHDVQFEQAVRESLQSILDQIKK